MYHVPCLQDFEYTEDYMRKKRILNPLLGEGSGPHAFMELTSKSHYDVLTSLDYIVNLGGFRSEYLVLEACDQSNFERLLKVNTKISCPNHADAVVLIDSHIFSKYVSKYLWVPRSRALYLIKQAGPPSDISTPELDYDSLMTIPNIACSRCVGFGIEVDGDWSDSDSNEMICNATCEDEEQVINVGDPGCCPDECPIKRRLANYKPIFTELVKSNL